MILVVALGGIALWLGACLVLALIRPRVELDEASLQAPLPHFPTGFLFGAATSAHQLDGGGGLDDWSLFEAEPGRIARGEQSGSATGHRDRVAEDVALVASLGADAYRFSLDWGRLEPRDGAWDEAEWARTFAEVKAIRALGLTPMVTLLHFALPRWIAARGGPAAVDFTDRFGRFSGEAARRLGGEAKLFCTVNEPNVQVLFGWMDGVWPPGSRSPQGAARAFAGLVRGHAAAVRAIRAVVPEAQLGPAVNLVEFEPASRLSLLDWISVHAAESAFDWAFLDSIRNGRVRIVVPGGPSLDEPAPEVAGTMDWVGVNYYTRNALRFDPRAPGLVRRAPGPGPRSDLGWEVRPAGLLAVLRAAWARYRLPLYVTENGIADAEDRLRPAFLRAHLNAIARALAEGVPVRGYFHWSLLDNFEWADGFAPRFGLVAVDYRTLARTPRASAAVFRALVREARREH